MAEAVDSMGHGRNGPWPAARLPTTCSSACPPTACWSPRISSPPGPTSVWPVVLSVGGVWSGGVAGAVQEYRGDERGGFLDAGLLVGGQAGPGPGQAPPLHPQPPHRRSPPTPPPSHPPAPCPL